MWVRPGNSRLTCPSLAFQRNTGALSTFLPKFPVGLSCLSASLDPVASRSPQLPSNQLPQVDRPTVPSQAAPMSCLAVSAAQYMVLSQFVGGPYFPVNPPQRSEKFQI